MQRKPTVYLMANRPMGTIYTGVTGNLPRRIWQHRNGITKGFCAKYNIDRLVYYEQFEDMYEAISREKQIKSGSRSAKVKLIERGNPDWRDLYLEILG